MMELRTGRTKDRKTALVEVTFPEECMQTVKYRNGKEKENSPRGNLILVTLEVAFDTLAIESPFQLF